MKTDELRNILANEIKSLAQLRNQDNALQVELKLLKEEAEARFNEEFGELIENARLAKCQMMDAESEIRCHAVTLYGLDGSTKQPVPGIGMRETKNYVYEDGKAFDWAKGHLMCLQLDSKAFKDVCKNDSTRPDFVSIDTTVTATIATDLSSVIGSEGKP